MERGIGRQDENREEERWEGGIEERGGQGKRGEESRGIGGGKIMKRGSGEI